VRAEFLREHCGDNEELRRDVESLLDSGSDDAVPPGAPPGRLILNDRYEVERELGRGGMSVVYLVRDRQLLAKHVVVKVLLEETSQDAWVQQKFLQEMEALSRIDHPGVVGVLDTGLTADGQRFLVMQYIEGATLRSAIEPGGMELARAAGIIRQIGQALEAAHEKGVWHRDLKPENVMLQRLGGEDHVKLIDFGIAGIQNSQFTAEKTQVAGSLAYMAPEQLGGRPCAASDTYSLAIVASEMLAGTRTEKPRELRPELPEAAERSIRKARSLHPEERHGSVREFSEELWHALCDGRTTRKPTGSGTVEMAHVLFTDLVGYSLLPMDQQKQYLGELQRIVQSSPQYRAAEAAGDLISLPTGDGMALAFFGDPTAAAQCALEVAAGLKSRPHLQLRMGIHSGPVYRVADVNANANVAGGGINMAQRVMDCGDAGHILVSKTMSDVLLQFSQWAPYLTDLGECTVKHGVTVRIYNLATAEVGNRQRPRKLGAATPGVRSRLIPAGAIVALVVTAAVAGAFWWGQRRKVDPSGQDLSSIAVLPFEDLSIDKNQEYFSKGLAEELLDALATIPGLRVAGQTSSFQFNGKTADYPAIGRKLHVASILEGSVSKQGNRARIRVRLVQAADEYYLWSENYDREMNDIFAVQNDIARSVAGALKVKLLGGKIQGLAAKSASPDAFNAYLMGRHFKEQGDQANLEKAVGYFEQAIQIAPGYAGAWAELGVCRTRQAARVYVPAEEGYRKAREAVDQALALDGTLGEGYSARGMLEMVHDWNWVGADTSLQRGLALAPGNADMILRAGILARTLGRFSDAVELSRRSMQIDPLYPSSFHNAGLALYYAGQNDEASAAFRKALELAPQMPFEHAYLGQVYLAQSRHEEALKEALQEQHPLYRLHALALAFHALGRKKEADATLEDLIAKFHDDPTQIGEVYAFRGETERSLEWLERAYKQRDDGLIQIKGDPLLNRLKGDARYTGLLAKMHLPQ
jgi:TolB-like protein/class 3 adenylate cyclase/tRNA A-37 threonylcarbamoyl transferase component Bud32/Tfp pilus assembly protein PilF